MTVPRSRLDAYWFWGALPGEAKMRRQLADFRDKGFHRIYIQARLSMPRAVYLSEPYLAAYAKAITLMDELGLRAGLYDDYSWTSGQAGGRTVDGADHLRERHVFWARTANPAQSISGIRARLGASLGPAVRAWIHEGGTPCFADWQLVGAMLETAGRVEDISDAVICDGAGQFRLLRPLPKGAAWTVFAAARATNSRIINYLMPEAGARFVEVGLEPYVRALGAHLGRTVDCLFFDQPAPVLYDWEQRCGNLLNSLPWSDEFADTLACDGPLAPQLYALVAQGGDREIRSRVYRRLTAMMQAAFLRPLRDFCDRNGLKLTGHEILPHVSSMALNGGFSSIDPRVSLAADFFGTDLWRDETAVDANNLEAQLAPLLGDSLARASGRRGAWVELYLTGDRCDDARASGRWELTPMDLRGQMIRLHMMGASRVILHALYAEAGDDTPSVLDNMRFDFAPGYNLQPWWPVMRDLAHETTALADFIEGAAPPDQMLILYPYETALQEGPRHSHAETFGAACSVMLDHGHKPLIVDEAGLARIRDGQLFGSRVAGIIVPGEVKFCDPQTAARIAALGGPAPLIIPHALPQVRPQLGLRALIAGLDGEGSWRIVLFNEGQSPCNAALVWPQGETQREIYIAVAPQELRCLTLPLSKLAEIDKIETDQLGPVVQHISEGWQLTTPFGKRPIKVTQGWQAQGLAGFSGVGTYECRVTLDAAMTLDLQLPGLACAAQVWLDGLYMGGCYHAPFVVPLGDVAKGVHVLRIAVANTMANAYYQDTPFAGALWPDVSGLTCPPCLRLRKRE